MTSYTKKCIFRTARPRSKRLQEQGVSGVEQVINRGTGSATSGGGSTGDITGEQVISALGYTPYDAANPAGYGKGTVKRVKINNGLHQPDANGDVDLGTFGSYTVFDEETVSEIELSGAATPTISEQVLPYEDETYNMVVPSSYVEGVVHKIIIRNSSDGVVEVSWPSADYDVYHPTSVISPDGVEAVILEYFWANGKLFITMHNTTI